MGFICLDEDTNRMKTAITDHNKASNFHHAQSAGFSLIEVLVTVVIVSIGLLGIAGLQMSSLKNNDSSFLRSKSTIFSNDMIDYLRANRQQAIAGNYNIDLSSFSALSTPSGTPTIAETDRYRWFKQIDDNLPNAKAAINCDANAVCAIRVEWDDSRAEGSSSTKHLILSAQL